MWFSRLSTFVVLTGAMLAFGGMVPASSQVVVKTPSTTGSINFAERNEHQFKTAFRIGLAVRQTGLNEEEIRHAIDAMTLIAPDGRQVRDRVFVPGPRVVVGLSEPGIEPTMSAVKEIDGRMRLITGFRDASGAFVMPEPDSIGVFSLQGLTVPHLVEPFSGSEIPIHADLLIDRSGSMSSVLKTVKTAAAEFMAGLPRNALCRVTSFNNRYERHTKDYRSCVPALHRIGSVLAGGGTDIYTPLRQVYLDGPRNVAGMRIVVVVTDGLGRSRTSRDAVLDAKNAATFVFWRGNHSEDRLKGIADTFIYGKVDLRAQLDRYFGRIGAAISNQVVISVAPSPPIKGGKP